MTARKKEPRRNQEQSRALATVWWESFPKDARPVGNFIGLARILERGLDAGWDAGRLRRVLLDTLRDPYVPSTEQIAERYGRLSRIEARQMETRAVETPQRPPPTGGWQDLDDAGLRDRWESMDDLARHREIVEAVMAGVTLPWEEDELPYFARVARREGEARG